MATLKFNPSPLSGLCTPGLLCAYRIQIETISINNARYPSSMAAGLNAAWAFLVSEAPLFVHGCLGVDYPLNFDKGDIPWCMLLADDVVLVDENQVGVNRKLEL